MVLLKKIHVGPDVDFSWFHTDALGATKSGKRFRRRKGAGLLCFLLIDHISAKVQVNSLYSSLKFELSVFSFLSRLPSSCGQQSHLHNLLDEGSSRPSRGSGCC